MKNKITTGRKFMFAALLTLVLAVCAAAQTSNPGDTVQTPDGRTGVVEAIKNETMAKVKFGDGTIKFYMRADLRKVEPPKPARTEPQETFRVGDVVVDSSKPESVYREGTIESFRGNEALVKFGPYKYDRFSANLKDLVSKQTWERRKKAENEGELLRAGFEDEAKPFENTVRSLALAYNPKFSYVFQLGIADAATYEKWRKDLEALAAVCQKYPNLTNSADADSVDEDSDFRHHPADWCKIAEQRAALIKIHKKSATGMTTGILVRRWNLEIDQLLRNWDGYVKDDMQMLLYDRAAWELKYLQDLVKKYAETGEQMPPSDLAALDEKVKELKAKIEADAATRKWEQPQYTDAAFEAIVRKTYPSQFPGVKVFKTGMTFGTWKAEDDTSLVGSGTGYKVYRTTKGAYRYKLGLALVKLPNQPLCQIRDFEFHQNKAGAGYTAGKLYLPLGYAGIFVKCP